MSEILNENNESNLSFEDFKNENGITYWWASDLMKMLGYQNMKSFQKVLDRGTKAFVSLNIPHYENIIPIKRQDGHSEFQDFKLTRFACYLLAMNGDPQKEEVAIAQAYFANQTRKFELFIDGGDDFDRLFIRDEISEGNKSLAKTASSAGVIDYAKFNNAGYLGMYNMKSWELEVKRDVKKGKLMDNMGRTELAANLFRITQTEERIKSRKIKGQTNLEKTHHTVGKEVRNMVRQNVGKFPENLIQEKELPNVKKELKQGYKKMNESDANKKKK